MAAHAEQLFAALADPTRWRVLSLLAERGEATATTLAGQLPVSRVAVVKHLGVLDRAGLAAEWDQRLAAIKRLAEGEEPPAR